MLLKLKACKFRTLVLTFDDGPGSRLTTSILEILAEHNVKATFFLLGRNIPGREDIVKQIEEQGHEICSHGYDHLHHWKVSPIRAIKDIKRGWQAINVALGVNSDKCPYRPPYGKLNLVSLLYLLLLRVPVCYWTRDLGDTWLPNKRKNQSTSFTRAKLVGDVTLAHDFDRPDMGMDPFILELVKSTLALAQKSKLRVMTASELFNVNQ
jgi:peptidoglycan/xylan/chitin deacetylase (PgdA/CDA1 family)